MRIAPSRTREAVFDASGLFNDRNGAYHSFLKTLRVVILGNARRDSASLFASKIRRSGANDHKTGCVPRGHGDEDVEYVADGPRSVGLL